MGASLGGLWVGDRPVLRPWSGQVEDGPFAVASIVLAPVSNRVSRPFDWGGGTHTLPRNLASEAFPIHGDAFGKPWTVARKDPRSIELALGDGAFGPLLYQARLTYEITPEAFSSALTLTSRCNAPMPFGAGFHPWFPHDRDTRIAFSATGVWLEDDRHLPAGDRPIALPDAWNFATARPLPATWINNGFADWDRRLRIAQGEAAVSLTMHACRELDTLILFFPASGADFFCAEPVSHPVDALNLPGRPGLAVLEPGETMTVWMRMEWEP